MSYYRKEGYRIVPDGYFDDEKRDFVRTFSIEFRALDGLVSGPEHNRWTEKEHAEEAAQEILEKHPELSDEDGDNPWVPEESDVAEKTGEKK